MQKEKFISFLENPFTENENVIQQIKEITEEFPYFQTAHSTKLNIP